METIHEQPSGYAVRSVPQRTHLSAQRHAGHVALVSDRLQELPTGNSRRHSAVANTADAAAFRRAATGLRISEVLNLRQSAVDYDNLILNVFGKGQKERLVPFSPELRKRLFRFDQVKGKKGIRCEFLFGGVSGSRWEKRNSATSLYLMERKLGLPQFGWHRLRHTFATNYLRRGGDIVRLSMVLGHTQIT